MNIAVILAELFVAAMAVFGLWCAFRFLMLDLSVRSRVTCAVALRSASDIEELEEILCALDLAMLFDQNKKYALLLSGEALQKIDSIELSDELRKRVELYAFLEIPKKE